MNQPSLAAKIERARQGDSEAWGQVYEELAPLVFRLCRRVLPTREDAEDATTEVFLKAQIHLDQYDTARPFKTWLYRVTANHCWDELRRRRGRRETEAMELDRQMVQTSEPGPHQELLARQTREEVRSALAKLNDRDRLVVSLRYLAELSYEEIAEAMGVTPTSVGVWLLRARQKLRRILSTSEKR